MLARLEWMTIKPEVVVDLGCGTGEMSRRLQERYTEAHVIALDLSEDMIRQAKQQAAHTSCVCAEARCLPLQDQSVDLIFANLLFPWQEEVESLLRECRRVLRPEGLLMFTAFGPDTMKEWQGIPKQNIAPVFLDMHLVGDAMLEMKYADPVLDVNYYTLTYRQQALMFQELYATGMLVQAAEINDENDLPPAENGQWEVTYEIIFAHAFVSAESEEVAASADGIVRIPLAHLRRQLRS